MSKTQKTTTGYYMLLYVVILDSCLQIDRLDLHVPSNKNFPQPEIQDSYIRVSTVHDLSIENLLPHCPYLMQNKFMANSLQSDC